MPHAQTPSAAMLDRQQLIQGLDALEERLLWLASWTIHNANHIRPSRDGLKVGGHQASCASMTTLMAALYFHVLRPQDRVAVKPHASPVLHAVEYLFDRQSREQMEQFRAFGGMQSYPSRTKDDIRVDFSTGSVGLGVAITAFASLVQDMWMARGDMAADQAGRFISLLGDAELDEGNIYEALIEAYKHDIRNTWWIVDYNRQSLDATTSEKMFDRFDDMFETAGWDVLTLKYGARQRAAFKKPGGARLRQWIDDCPNDLYAALTYQGGEAWRRRLSRDLAGSPKSLELIASYDDETLGSLMTELGGHCLVTLLEAFKKAAATESPKLIIAYTTKGRRLPFQGHKDNHAGLMTPTQLGALRDKLNISEGKEWDKLAGLSDARAAQAKNVLAAAPWRAAEKESRTPPSVTVPALVDMPDPGRSKSSTQVAFGKILNDLAREDTDFVSRIVTTSPDVTVSTNLGGFVNRKGLFSRTASEDVFRKRKIASPQIWAHSPKGQHVELGIAENNLFLMLGALGLSKDLFDRRLFPVGTVYDPFIARGLDALNYACYQDARFILAATPSGLTLGPEGGAHQSISSPLIGMGQPGLTYWEPAFADEVRVILREAFAAIERVGGGSSYLRLSTRAIEQIDRDMTDPLASAILNGAYWLREPAEHAEIAIAYTGAVAPEALSAYEQLVEDVPGAGLLAITSPDILHTDWMAATRSPWTGETGPESHIQRLLSVLRPGASLVTVIDGAPSTLSWLGAVNGQRVRPLGTERFGQTGDLQDLYSAYRLDADAILDAAANLLV
ncbi:MAG: 1-deoxy-D-xylulose-5-phosphate synthase N-terminal domain-containing protein [Pseudomonadota bacterium]